MRKTLIVLLAVVLVVPLVLAVPAAAQPIKPVTCDIDFTFNPLLFIYEGEATNCEYAGLVESYVFEAFFYGNTEHWVGATVLYPNAGGVIVIAEKGVWNFIDPNLDNPDTRCDLEPDPLPDNEDPPPHACLKYRTHGEVVDQLVIRGQSIGTTYEGVTGAKTHGMGYTSFFDPLDFPSADYEFLAEQTLRFH